MNYEEEINKIHCRNHKVEANKAWETSTTRKLVVAILTYFVMICVMYVLKMENPFISAIIPTLGYLLSTLSAGLIKKLWVNRYYSISKTSN